jgi:hypothetical protein
MGLAGVIAVGALFVIVGLPLRVMLWPFRLPLRILKLGGIKAGSLSSGG